MNNSHKDSAIEFLKLVSENNIDEAFERFVSPEMKHHNPYFKGDIESLKQGMEENAKDFPEKEYKVAQVFEDGEYVIVHGLVTLTSDTQLAVVHILKFSEEKIIEMWDLGMEVPKDSPNQRGVL